MNLDLVKTIVGITAQLGAGAVTTAIIRNNVPIKTGINTITVPVAGIAFGGIAANACKQHTDSICDEVATLITTIKAMKNAPTAAV